MQTTSRGRCRGFVKSWMDMDQVWLHRIVRIICIMGRARIVIVHSICTRESGGLLRNFLSYLRIRALRLRTAHFIKVIGLGSTRIIVCK